MHKSESVLENETYKILRDFEIQTNYLITAKRPDLVIISKKKRKKTCRIVDFAVPVDDRMKIKENEKRDKYLDLARELRKQLNIRVTVIPIVVGALGTVPKGLEGGWGNWKSENQSRSFRQQHCWEQPEYYNMETWWDSLSLRLQ